MASPVSSGGSTPPPPLELVRDDDHDHDDDHVDVLDGRRGLAARLAPWLEWLAPGAVHWALLPTHGGALGVVVELRANVSDDVLDDDDEFEHVLQLREAVDLALLALAVEPAALGALLHRREWDDPVESMPLDREDAIESVVAHGARTELRLRLEFEGLQTRLLQDQLGPRFIRNAGGQLSANRGFRRLRRELIDRLRQDEAALARVCQVVVPVTIAIDSGPLRRVSLLDADDFFVHLTDFSRALARTRARTTDTPWRLDTQPVAMAVEGMDLTLRRFCITHRVAQAAKSFMAAGTPVRVKGLNLDPRLISCADQDVRDFVETLTTGANDLRIDTGVTPDEEFPEAIDEHGQNRSETIQVILGAIARVESVRELNLGGLLTLCVAPHNRRTVWQSIFRHVLSRDVIPETITFEDQVVFEPEDPDFVREEVALWREKHPGRKLFIKNVFLRLQSTESDTIEQFLQALDDAESVELRNGIAGNLSPRVLYRLLSFPSLKRLKVERQTVPSMDIFDPAIADPQLPTKPVLEELALDDLMLLDLPSMPRFLDKLRWDVDPRHVLATTLERFSVAQNVAGWEDLYIWDQAALEALDQALTTNRSLREVRALMDLNEDFYGEYQTRLDAHTRCPLPATSAVRKSEVVRARNLAFLSAIRSGGGSARSLLDAAAVSRIFTFAAPHQMRSVDLRPWDQF